MSETERRQRYVTNRVLIEAQRILNPQFDDAVVFLSGAQIELLRNVTQYLNRQSAYVAEYNPGYYLTPTVEDFDSILEIVADMEETLMGNPNTIWGYSDVYERIHNLASSPAGEANMWGDVVPEGEVWRILQAALETDSVSCTKVRVRAVIDNTQHVVQEVKSPTLNDLHSLAIDVVLKDGDRLYFTWSGMTLGDSAQAYYSGYRMVVPA